MIPLVSVVLPVHNDEESLSQCLDSIINQTMSDIEIICIDDSSSDSSMDILHDYITLDSRIILLKDQNQGKCASCNAGLEFAKGKYIYFCDPNYICYNDLFEKTVAHALQTNADIVAFDSIKYRDNGSKYTEAGIYNKWLPKGIDVFSYKDCPNRIMSILNPELNNKLFRTEFLKSNNIYFDEIYSNNGVAFSEIACAMANRIAFIKESLVYSDSNHLYAINTLDNMQLDNVILEIDSVLNRIKCLPYYNDIQDSCTYFIISYIIYSFDNYASNFKSDDCHDFYNYIHEYFCGEDCLRLSSDDFPNYKVYQSYIAIKQSCYDDMLLLRSKKLIVSLTSFPERINSVISTLDTIYAQTQQPDLIILWLAADQFPDKEYNLPIQLIEYQNNGKLDIQWCSTDIKSHKKYLYAMLEYPNDLIITIDDDLLYVPDMVECLYRSYLAYPKAVSTTRAHLIALSENGDLLPYSLWPMEIDQFINMPSMYFLATSGSGTLYPSDLMPHDLLDEKLVMEICPTADDLWLKTMQLVANIPVVVACEFQRLKFVPDSQTISLYHTNISGGKNDETLAAINNWLYQHFNGLSWTKLIKNSIYDKDFSYQTTFCTIIRKIQRVDASKLRRANAKYSEINNKLQQTYAEKSEINAKLQQTYAEKSEINAKLQRTYKEKAERGIRIKELESQIKELEQQSTSAQQELDATRASFSFRLGQALTRPARWLRSKLRS